MTDNTLENTTEKVPENVAGNVPEGTQEVMQYRGFHVKKSNTIPQIGVVLSGNYGVNNAAQIIDRRRAKDNPGLSFLVVEADGPLLTDRLSPDECSVEGRKEHLKEWYAAERLEIAHLTSSKTGKLNKEEDTSSEKPAAGRIVRRVPQRFFGGGGDPEIGRDLVEGSRRRIKKWMANNKDVIINFAGLGGAIGTSVAKVVAEDAKEIGVPFITMAGTPFESEGKKVAIADATLDILRGFGPVLAIHNWKLAKNQRKFSRQVIYDQINAACMPIFDILQAYIQQVGTTANSDLNDILKALVSAIGRDVMVGFYDVLSGEIPADNSENNNLTVKPNKVAKALLHPAFQYHGIRAEALLFNFEGPGWDFDLQDQISQLVETETGLDSVRGIKKTQDFALGTVRRASVIAVGTFPEEEKKAKKGESPEVPPLEAQEPAEGQEAPHVEPEKPPLEQEEPVPIAVVAPAVVVEEASEAEHEIPVQAEDHVPADEPPLPAEVSAQVGEDLLQTSAQVTEGATLEPLTREYLEEKYSSALVIRYYAVKGRFLGKQLFNPPLNLAAKWESFEGKKITLDALPELERLQEEMTIFNKKGDKPKLPPQALELIINHNGGRLHPVEVK